MICDAHMHFFSPGFFDTLGAQKGLPLDENDCWIAATALAAGATLVSRDTDFQQIDGLSVINWSIQ